jgi:hypothetical protein
MEKVLRHHFAFWFLVFSERPSASATMEAHNNIEAPPRPP